MSPSVLSCKKAYYMPHMCSMPCPVFINKQAFIFSFDQSGLTLAVTSVLHFRCCIICTILTLTQIHWGRRPKEVRQRQTDMDKSIQTQIQTSHVRVCLSVCLSNNTLIRSSPTSHTFCSACKIQQRIGPSLSENLKRTQMWTGYGRLHNVTFYDLGNTRLRGPALHIIINIYTIYNVWRNREFPMSLFERVWLLTFTSQLWLLKLSCSQQPAQWLLLSQMEQGSLSVEYGMGWHG